MTLHMGNGMSPGSRKKHDNDDDDTKAPLCHLTVMQQGGAAAHCLTQSLAQLLSFFFFSYTK